MDSWEPGVFNQMRYEQSAANRLGIPWQSRLFSPAPMELDSPVLVRPNVDKSASESLVAATLRGIFRRAEYRNWIVSEQDNFDILLARYSVANPFHATLLKKVSKPIYSVHHTLEIPQLQISNHPLAQLLVAPERVLGSRWLKNVHGIISVTDEISCYQKKRMKESGKPAFLYPNGILFPEEVRCCDRRGQIPEILFVASEFKAWNGLDLLLESVSNSKKQFVLHLVGQVRTTDLERASSDSRVRIHGYLSTSEIAKLAEQCWVGLSTLALCRKGMEQACPLKVREYLLHGLPSYGSYQDIFPENVNFFRNGPPKIETILDFTHQMRQVSRESVITAVRPYISQELILQELYDGIKRAKKNR